MSLMRTSAIRLLAAIAFSLVGFASTLDVTTADTDCSLNRPLARASMSGCDLRNADLTFANLVRIDLRNARLGGANLKFAVLLDARMKGADFIKADLSFASLVNADLSGADLMGANLSSANLAGATLTGANLAGANLAGATLINANLAGANLTGADMQLATLVNADLTNANLGASNLTYANLGGANLSGASLAGANLAGVNLGEANVSGASFEGATFAGGYRRSGIRNADLNGATGLDTAKGLGAEGQPITGANPASSAPAQSSMTQPWPAGTAVKVAGNWELSIVSVIPDATKSVLAFHSVNKVPEDGYQYFLVTLRFTNVGTEPNEFRPDFRLRLMGSSMVPYDQYYSCGVIPRNVASGGWDVLSTRAYPGGAIEGNLCWRVKSSEVASLVLIDEGVRQDMKLPPAEYFSLPG